MTDYLRELAMGQIRIGLVGFGTVGAGVAKILLEDGDFIAKRTGLNLELAIVVDLDTTSPRPVTLPDGMLTDDIDKLLSDDSIDIAIELVGGTGSAKDIQLKMLQSGKHVITANKALLAEHGAELYAAAKANGKCIAFEASCGAGIPIVSAIRTGLSANRIDTIYGIMNGTCNYILSSMTADGSEFADALKAAQDKGYAEADPTLDIGGGDSAHKLAILAWLAFGCKINYDDIYIEGIEKVNIDDIRYGEEMGYTLKLLAIGQRGENEKISLRVHPAFVASDSPIAGVGGAFNAISVFGNSAGKTMYYGRGAGMMPTASAVVADVIEVGRGNSQRLFDGLATVSSCEIESIDNLSSKFYFRLMVIDKPGTFAKIANVLEEHNISISGILQHEGKDKRAVPVVVITHQNQQKNVTAALNDIAALDITCAEPVCIRIVEIPEDNIGN